LSDDARGDAVRSWIAENIGGTIEKFDTIPRWRGGWMVDVHRDGEVLGLYVREERKEDYPPWPLEHEASILQLLERHAIPVPHVYGVIDKPHATVMSRLPGTTSFAGIVSEAERISVLEHYAKVLADIRRIDPEEMVALGVRMPVTDEEIALPCYGLCEEMYLKGKSRPDPRIEFLRQWIRRNIPRSDGNVGVITVDTGQFMQKDGKVSGLFDFEYACLGDPVIDLAFVPRRASHEGMGDLSPFFRHYEVLTGEKLSRDRLVFHTVWWGLVTPFITTGDLHAPRPEANYYDYVGWYLCSLYSTFDTLADHMGLDLPGEPPAFKVEPSRWAPIYDVMAGRVPAPGPGESFALQEQRKFIEFARSIDACRANEDGYLREVGELLGREFPSWLAADTELEKFVLQAGPEHDGALVSLFHRWCAGQLTSLFKGFPYSPFERPPVQQFSELIPD